MPATSTAKKKAKNLNHLELAAYGSLVIAILSLLVSGMAFYIQSKALHDSEQAQQQTMQLAFQQQYEAIRAGFPDRYAEEDFKPKVGSSDFVRLDAYWIFCFSEWSATGRLDPTGDAWNYYAQLMANGLHNRALRYVLETRILNTHGPVSPAWKAFYRELAHLARGKNKEPLDKDVEDKIKGLHVYQ